MTRPSKQEIADMRNAARLEEAYMAANQTAPAPASAGAGRGFVNPPMAAPTTGMKKGGMAKGGSASKRADGIAVKGKTRGTMITMCDGGMYKK